MEANKPGVLPEKVLVELTPTELLTIDAILTAGEAAICARVQPGTMLAALVGPAIQSVLHRLQSLGFAESKAGALKIHKIADKFIAEGR